MGGGQEENGEARGRKSYSFRERRTELRNSCKRRKRELLLDRLQEPERMRNRKIFKGGEKREKQPSFNFQNWTHTNKLQLNSLILVTIYNH